MGSFIMNQCDLIYLFAYVHIQLTHPLTRTLTGFKRSYKMNLVRNMSMASFEQNIHLVRLMMVDALKIKSKQRVPSAW